MPPARPTSGKAAASLLAGLLAVACGVLALANESDLFLLGVAVYSVVAFGCGLAAWADINRSPERLRGRALAGWGMGLPACGLALGLLLLPFT